LSVDSASISQDYHGSGRKAKKSSKKRRKSKTKTKVEEVDRVRVEEVSADVSNRAFTMCYL